MMQQHIAQRFHQYNYATTRRAMSKSFCCAHLSIEVRGIVNKKTVLEGQENVQAALLDYTLTCYPSVTDKFRRLLSILPDIHAMASRAKIISIQNTAPVVRPPRRYSWKCYMQNEKYK
ncbi:unnamed protein product [Ceratitis capitata]|uniref:(Mediterranean fruit fly) hypothetical protein n=1 Tax=Ceratitis capitata TaxID=7213 RepID=A0A811V8R5_CERCA|nr:unnamed protein product [Ceratitis capitata]